MDVSLNVESNTSDPIDDKEKHFGKAKPIKFRPGGAILESQTSPNNSPGRGSHSQREDCMQPKIRLERLCLGDYGGSNPLHGYVSVRDIPNCYRMENGLCETIERDSSVDTGGLVTVNQNHASMDDKAMHCGFKRVRTPSSTPNKKKPYRSVARRDESGITPSTGSVAAEQVHNGNDIVLKSYMEVSPDYRAADSSSNHQSAKQSDDRTHKTAIGPWSSLPAESKEVRVEPMPPLVEVPVVDISLAYQEESQSVATSVSVVAQSSGDQQRSVKDANGVPEERSPVPTTVMQNTDGLVSHLEGVVLSLGESEAAECSETDASTLRMLVDWNTDTKYRKTRETPSYWRRGNANESAASVETRTGVACERRRRAPRRIYPTKKAVVRPRIARSFHKKRSTSYYFRGKISLAGLQSTRTKTGKLSRNLADERHNGSRWSRKARILKALKSTSDGSRRVSLTDKKVTPSLRYSTGRTNRSTEQLMRLPGVQVNSDTENFDKAKPSSVEVVSRKGEDLCSSSSSAPTSNPTDVQNSENIYRSMFDNFVENEVGVCCQVDETDEGRVSLKTDSTLSDVPATDNRRDNIFDRFRSSMQDRGDTTGDCLNLSRKKDRDVSERRPVPDTSREKEEPCGDAVPPSEQHTKDIKELLGDYDSDSTECCKYDDLDEIYAENQTTKDAAQLGGYMAERTEENFYPGFSVFNMLSDSDDNLCVDESRDSQAVEASPDQKASEQEPSHANSDDEDRQLKKLRSTAYRTYTRKRKQMMLKKGGVGGAGDGSATTNMGSRQMTSSNSAPSAENEAVQLQVEDLRTKAQDSKAEQVEGKRGRGRSPKKTTNIKTPMKRRKTGLGKSSKTVPASRHTLLAERKKANAATKKRANVSKEFATRSKTRNRDVDGPNVPLGNNSASPINREVSESTGSNDETNAGNVKAAPRGKFRDKKIRNVGCRRSQGRPPTKKALATGSETRPGRRKTSASKSKDDPETTKDQPPRMDILSRELGPRFNWLEQKIQAMQRSCSDEGLDTRAQRPSPETQTSSAGPPKRASNDTYESDGECRGPGPKRWSGEDHRLRQEDEDPFPDYTVTRSRSENGHVTKEDLPADSDQRLTKSSGFLSNFDDFYDSALPSLAGTRLSSGPRMSPNLVWSVAVPSVITTTAMPLGLKLVRTSAANGTPSPSDNPVDSWSPSAFAAAPAVSSSLNGINDEEEEEGALVMAEPLRPLSLSPAVSSAVLYYDHRLSNSLGASSSRRESGLETSETPNGVRTFPATSYDSPAAGSPFVPDFSLGSAASNFDPRLAVVPEPVNAFPLSPELEPSDLQGPFDLSRSAVRSKQPPELELSNEHMENITSSRNSLQDERLTPLQLTIAAHSKPPSESESTIAETRTDYPESELYKEGLITGAAAAATQGGVKVAESGIAAGETVIDLTTDVDPVPSNSDGDPRSEKPFPPQDCSSEPRSQQDTRSTPVLRSIKYEYVRRLEMYERLSKVSKIKDQEIAILESERKRVKKELDCLKNIFVRATAGLPQGNDDRSGERANEAGADRAAETPTVVESSWSPVGEAASETRKAKEAHRRESTVRLVASRTPPEAHSVKMDLSMYTYLKCQYKQDRLKIEEELRGESYVPDYGPQTEARDTENCEAAKVLMTPPAHSTSTPPARSSSMSSSEQASPYRPARVGGPYSQGNQAWSSVQSGDCLNGTDSRRPCTDSALGASGSSRHVSSLAESNPELGLSRPRSLQTSDANETATLTSQFGDFNSNKAIQQQELNRRRPQNLSEPSSRYPTQETGVRVMQEVQSASQPCRPSSNTAEIQRRPLPQQHLITEDRIDKIRMTLPEAHSVFNLDEHQAQSGLVNPDDHKRLSRKQALLNSTDKPSARNDPIPGSARPLRSDSQGRQIDGIACPPDNQYEVVDLSKSCPGRSMISPLELSQIKGGDAGRRSATGPIEDDTPMALDLKSGQKDTNASKSLVLRSSGAVERDDALDGDVSKDTGADHQMLDYSQARRYSIPTRIAEETQVNRDRISFVKSQMSDESEVHGLRNSNSHSSKVSYVQPDGDDKGNMEPVDLKIVAVQDPTLSRDQPKLQERTGGVLPLRSGAPRPVPTQGLSEIIAAGSETDLKGHSIRNLIPDIVPQQQQRARERMKSFDPSKIIVTQAERTTAQGEAEKPEGSTSPKTNGRRTSRRWPKQQKSPQQGFFPDKYGLSSNLQDMSFMVNSISSGGGSYYNATTTGVDQPRSTSDPQAPPVENEQRSTVQPDMQSNLSPTYNTKALAQRPGYEHGEKRGPPLAPYTSEPQGMLRQRPVEAGARFTNLQTRDPNSLQTPTAADLESIRQHAAKEAVVYRLDDSSSTSGAPPMQRYGELQQQGVAHRGIRDDVAHLQQMRHPAPPPFRPSNSPVVEHRDSAFVPLASQRREIVNARQQPIEQLPQNDPSRHGNPDPYHLRQHQPGIGSYPQQAPPMPGPRQAETQMQQRYYGSGSMAHPPDTQQAQPVNRNDRIPLPVYQKSAQQPPFVQQVRQENVPRGAHPQMATHRLVPHQMDLVPSSDAGRSAYGTVMLNPRVGLELQRLETSVIPSGPEDGLLFQGQPRSDGMAISRIVMQQAQRSQASAAGFQDTGRSLRVSGPEPIGFAPHPAPPGIDPSRIPAGWRVSQEYAVRGGVQENQQMQQETAGRNSSARHAPEQRAMGLVDQRTLGVAPVSEQMSSSRGGGDPSQLRPQHPSQLMGSDRYLPSYMESIAGAPQPQQVTPYRISGLMQPPVPSVGHPSRQPGKEDSHRLPAPQRHAGEQAQPLTAISMRGDGLRFFPPQQQQAIFSVPPGTGMVNPAFGAVGHNNPTQVERIHLRPGYDLQKSQESFAPAAYAPYDRNVQLLSGHSGGLSGLAVQPTNMTSGRQQRPDEVQTHPVKANQASIHQGLEGYKQPQQQQQQQLPQQRGQATKAVDYICDVCRKPAMFVCSACKGVAYCSTECQAISWQTRHSSMCRQL